MDERELVILASEGNGDAFASLYEIYHEKLFKYAVYTLRTVEDAEDVVADTVCEVFHSIKKLKNPEFFGPWIFKILSNKCKSKMREYYIFNHNQEESFEDEAIWMNLDISISLKRAFNNLNIKEKTVVAMSVFGGYDSIEIGRILHINSNTVRSLRKRALSKMAREIND